MHVLNDILKRLIQNTYQFQLAHWEFRGPNFMEIHKLTQEQYEYLFNLQDEVAELILQSGGTIEKDTLDVTRELFIEDKPLETLIVILGDLISQFGYLASQSEDAHGHILADFAAENLRKLAKHKWLLESHLIK